MQREQGILTILLRAGYSPRDCGGLSPDSGSAMKWACQVPVSKLSMPARDEAVSRAVEILLAGYVRTSPLSVRWVDNATDPVTLDIYRSMGVEPAEYMVALVECEVSTPACPRTQP